MESKEVGEVDVATGTLNDTKYHVFCMKEPDYVMKLMSTYGDTTVPLHQEETYQSYEVEKNGKKEKVKKFSSTQLPFPTI